MKNERFHFCQPTCFDCAIWKKCIICPACNNTLKPGIQLNSAVGMHCELCDKEYCINESTCDLWDGWNRNSEKIEKIYLCEALSDEDADKMLYELHDLKE